MELMGLKASLTAPHLRRSRGPTRSLHPGKCADVAVLKFAMARIPGTKSSPRQHARQQAFCMALTALPCCRLDYTEWVSGTEVTDERMLAIHFALDHHGGAY